MVLKLAHIFLKKNLVKTKPSPYPGELYWILSVCALAASLLIFTLRHVRGLSEHPQPYMPQADSYQSHRWESRGLMPLEKFSVFPIVVQL